MHPTPPGPAVDREPMQASHGDEGNPIGLDGVEFVEYATPRPQALGQVLETMGFRPVARHRSREVLLYRQGTLNVVVDASAPEHEDARAAAGDGTDAPPRLAAIGLRVRDAQAAWREVLARGGWPVPTHPGPMELAIPAIRGAGGSRVFFVDRWREFSIWDVDFVPIPSVDPHPPAIAGIRLFGVVQYVGTGRTGAWVEFYRELFGLERIPDDRRFGILPAGTLLRAPAADPADRFLVQLVEPMPDAPDGRERLVRIGLGVPDVPEAVRALRERGVRFVDGGAAHDGTRGALTRAWLGSVVFELVHDTRGEGT